MRLQRLDLTNVRCHGALVVEPGPAMTVLVGANGAGKTTVLEAAHVVLAGSSPRTKILRELIRQGEELLRVEATLSPDTNGPVSVAFGYAVTGDRRVSCNGLSLADCGRIEAMLPVRMFLPDDLQLIKGGPRLRRQYLDRLAGSGDVQFRQALTEYEEALRQRNHLLHKGIVGADHSPWEAMLADRGPAVGRGRERTLARFSPVFSRVHTVLAGPGGGSASVVYRTNTSGLEPAEYRERLAREREGDRQSGFTRSGPHRDDLRILLEHRDLRDYGSQGEQRTAVLALLLAEGRWLEEEGRQPPLLLLDDVMSELDQDRRRAFLTLVAPGQALITTTDLHYFAEEELAGMTVIPLRRCGGD